MRHNQPELIDMNAVNGQSRLICANILLLRKLVSISAAMVFSFCHGVLLVLLPSLILLLIQVRSNADTIDHAADAGISMKVVIMISKDGNRPRVFIILENTTNMRMRILSGPTTFGDRPGSEDNVIDGVNPKKNYLAYVYVDHSRKEWGKILPELAGSELVMSPMLLQPVELDPGQFSVIVRPFRIDDRLQDEMKNIRVIYGIDEQVATKYKTWHGTLVGYPSAVISLEIMPTGFPPWFVYWPDYFAVPK